MNGPYAENGKKIPVLKKRDNPWYVATMLLSVRPRSVSEMRKRLLAKHFTNEDVEKTIVECKKHGYLDDNKFAIAVCDSMLVSKTVGRRVFRQKLSSYGLSAVTIEATINDLITPEKELELAKKAFMKKKKQLLGSKIDKKLWYGKIGQFLAGKGFGIDTISVVLEQLKNEGSNDDQNVGEGGYFR
jgi:SOS response regulatory protein OraA/RecX